MKYAYVTTPGHIEIRDDMERPKLTPGHAILKLSHIGLCGSDVGVYRGTFAFCDYPRIPGHEFSAVIEEIGENDRGLKKGMVVTCNPYFNCGHCSTCQSGYVNCCQTNQSMGCQRDGCMMEYISMPLERIYDGKGLPGDILATIEPFCISYHAIKRGNVQAGDKVLVVGAGTIGYFAAASAKLRGAEVYVTDISETKLKMVENLGIAGTIVNKDKETFKEKVAEITNGNGFDVTIEAVGLPTTFLDCLDAVKFHGKVIVIGVSKMETTFNYAVIQQKELDIYGSRNAVKADFEELIDMVSSGKIDTKSVITDMYDFKDVAQAYEDAVKYGAEKLKVMVKF